MNSWGIFFISLLLFSCSVKKEQKSGSRFKVENTRYSTYDGSGNVLSEVIIEQIPKKVIVLSSPHLSYLKMLNVESSICGVLGKRISTSEGQILESVGTFNQIDLEKIIELNPDLIFCNSGQLPDLGRLKELFPILVIDEYLSNSPIEKTRWIRFFGDVYGKGVLANRLLDKEKLNYIEKEKIGDKIIQLNHFSGKYYLPGCESYIASLVNDAGGDFACKNKSSNSQILSEEEAILFLNQNEYLLFFDWAKDSHGLEDRLSSLIQISKNKELRVIYCNAENSLFFERSIESPSLILNDLHLLLKTKKKTEFFSLLTVK